MKAITAAYGAVAFGATLLTVDMWLDGKDPLMLIIVAALACGIFLAGLPRVRAVHQGGSE